MPDDFIPMGVTFKTTEADPTSLEDRMQHVSALDRRTQLLFGTAVTGVSLEDFNKRPQSLRVATNKWGWSEIEIFFAQQLKDQCPDLRINGLAIENSNEFKEWVKKG